MQVEFIGQSVDINAAYVDEERIEAAARTCTQTDMGDDHKGFVARLLERGHMSPLEFGYAEMLIECDRAIQQELTRHRHFSFNVESTRWCDYTKKPLRFVTKPPEDMDVSDEWVKVLEELCRDCASTYELMVKSGVPRDYARKCLPLATASKMRMAGNPRTWIEMLPKRLVKAAHPEIREVARKVRDELVNFSSTLFGGL